MAKLVKQEFDQQSSAMSKMKEILTLKQEKAAIKNQLNKLTERPTLRWIFQCFQGIHVVITQGVEQIINLNESRRRILQFLPNSCQKYYLLSENIGAYY